MQGTSYANLQLLAAPALWGHLIDPHLVAALLADYRRQLLPDEIFGDLFLRGEDARRCLPT